MRTLSREVAAPAAPRHPAGLAPGTRPQPPVQVSSSSLALGWAESALAVHLDSVDAHEAAQARAAEYARVLDVARLAVASGASDSQLLAPVVAAGSDWLTINAVLQATQDAAWARGFAAGRRPVGLPFSPPVRAGLAPGACHPRTRC